MPGMWPEEREAIYKKLDKIVELLEQLVNAEQATAEQVELSTHRSGCKCGRC